MNVLPTLTAKRFLLRQILPSPHHDSHNRLPTPLNWHGVLLPGNRHPASHARVRPY
ncbi:hypothetical protein [Nitrospira lenta]|uniref:hypothetical protein n=1 Tax=Nitrospira lenta TaxID=1436998 RepID=UPI0015E8E536|nr:hypothetical protein [Nitrospira lenta]